METLTTVSGEFRIDYHEPCADLDFEPDCAGPGWYFDLAREDSGTKHYSEAYASPELALAAAEEWEAEQVRADANG